ncbi:ABC transporter ATP-binding protein [Variovorax sp. VRV01]|uniref:ABC transporter ATP-binding protein n=1 Tax=Variovorax sp. VRV01 TaxID=2769259 RepID=UPI00177CE838|nr:ABC transporter ATP-binding protein [Variovorax sp. VRV01]MBD9665463.1 ABC transporter ATP-binding protein [Variovorax sp. VRV01]
MSEHILELNRVSRRYTPRKGLLGRGPTVHAVDEVSLAVRQGTTLGLVGESGSGKSTTGRMALGFEVPDEGEVRVRGQSLPRAGTLAWRRMRADMQMIYQDPLAALDRRLPVLEQVREPLDIHGVGDAQGRSDAALAMLGSVGLGADHGRRLPHELSGGQRQRVVLARALVTQPELLVCDEPVSALDVSIQAQVVNLLVDLQARLGLSILFISHDLRVVRHVSHRIAVMYLGRIVEQGDTDLILSAPAHPYTQALISAAPASGFRAKRIALKGEPPSPTARPTGCAFHPRCPAARPQCGTERPVMREVSSGHHVACHLAIGEVEPARDRV